MKKVWLLLFFLPLMIFSIEPASTRILTPRGETNPVEENKKIVLDYLDAFSKNDIREIEKTLSPNYKVQDSNVIFDSTYSKFDAFSKNIKVRVKALHEALPEFKLQILEVLGEGHKVLARIQISGVQKGPFLGVEPTQKPIVIKSFILFTIDSGKITHINEVWNEFGVMKQMGYLIL